MTCDQRTLNMAAAGLSLAAGLLAMLAGRRDGIARLSGVIAVLGSAAWAAAAYQDLQRADDT